jgi:tRNA1(Val) A37 N6-methylase TrmN6
MDLPHADLERKIVVSDVKKLHQHFKAENFDGIISEPVLLPYYRELPKFDEVQEEVQKNVLPVYKTLLEQAIKLLKVGRRIGLVSPIINTVESKPIKLPLKKIAKALGFEIIDLMRVGRIQEKSSRTLNIRDQMERTLFDKGSERISREFYIFEKITANPKVKAEKKPFRFTSESDND